MLAVIITVVVSLALSAFFSGMEIAFLSSNKLKLEIEKKQSRAFGYVAGLFSKYPGQYITTILVGNNLALVIYSLQMSVLIQLLLVRSGLILGNGASYVIETLVSTLIIIFTAEFIPKAVVHLNPNFYYKNFAVPVYFFYLLFYPVAKLTTLIAVGIFKIFGLSLNREQRINTFNKVDLAHLLDEVSDSPEQQRRHRSGRTELSGRRSDQTFRRNAVFAIAGLRREYRQHHRFHPYQKPVPATRKHPGNH